MDEEGLAALALASLVGLVGCVSAVLTHLIVGVLPSGVLGGVYVDSVSIVVFVVVTAVLTVILAVGVDRVVDV